MRVVFFLSDVKVFLGGFYVLVGGFYVLFGVYLRFICFVLLYLLVVGAFVNWFFFV